MTLLLKLIAAGGFIAAVLMTYWTVLIAHTLNQD